MFNMGLVELLVVLVLIAALFVLTVRLFAWLWNITMPDVFGVREITFWQALRLLIIAAFLFSPAAATVGG